MKSPRPRALAYLRVSTARQAGEGESLDVQRSRLTAYAELHGLALLEVYVDAGISGKRMDTRPQLQEALQRLRAGDAEALLVCKLDRLTRSVRDAVDLMERSGREGWSLHSIGEHLDTGSAMGRFVVSLMASLAQLERERTGERVAEVWSHLRAHGRKTSGSVPFGFASDSAGNLLPMPEEQAVLAVIRTLKDEGMGNEAVARELNGRGYVTKGGKTWEGVQVHRALRNAKRFAAALARGA